MKNWIRNLLCKWLYEKEIDDIYTRMEDDLHYEKDRLRKEYASKHQVLEMQYATIKRENEYLNKLIIDNFNLNPKPLVISDFELRNTPMTNFNK